MSRRLFHLTTPDVWRTAAESGELRPASLEAEGFAHLSFDDQLRGTLALHFAQARFAGSQVLALELVQSSLGAELVVEPSRGGELFPHLYRGVRPHDVLRVFPLVRDPSGQWSLPDGVP